MTQDSMIQDAMVPARPLLPSATARRAINLDRGSGEGWATLRRTLALWRERARSRAELRRMPDHRLTDLPLDTSAILNERDKPFWKE